MRNLVLFFLLLFYTGTAVAQDGNDLVRTDLITDHSAIPGRGAKIGILFDIEPHWHLYWRNSGDSGRPTTINWKLPDGWRVGELKWPAPTKFKEGGDIITFAYENEVLLYADVYPPAEATNAEIQAEVTWLVCSSGPSGQCIPGRREHKLSVNVSADAMASDSAPVFQKFAGSVPLPLSSITNTMRFKDDANLSVTSLWIKDGEKHYLGLKLKGFSEPLYNAVQLFPRNSENIVVSEPHQLGEDPNEQFLLFPARAKGEFDPTELTAEAVFSSRLLSSPGKQSFFFSFPKEPASIQLPQTEPTKLIFQTHSIAEEAPRPPPATNLVFAFLSAFIAGIILNLMPCVLPIISIKVIGFLQHCDDELCSYRLVLTYCAGILGTFLALALTVISLREAGVQLGWGFQFQSPGFVFVLLAIIFALSLSLFDVFCAQLPGISLLYESVSNVKRPYLKQFFDGILTTLLSTPCTAPFLGTALVVAFTQPAAITIGIFLAIGAGLALPYVLIVSFPSTKRLLPKPGEWMNRLRHFMGFVLLGTVVWLLYVLDGLVPQASTWALTFMLFIAISFWLAGWIKEARLSRFATWESHGILVVLFSLTWYFLWPLVTNTEAAAYKDTAWQAYSPQAVHVAQSEGTPVFIDFTARWCVTCQVNKMGVLDTAAVQNAFSEKGVKLLRADWTNEDEYISEALIKYTGQKSVPQYVLIPAGDREHIVLPTILSRTYVKDVLEDL